MEVKTVCGPKNYTEAWKVALNVVFDSAVVLCCAARQILFPVENAYCAGRFREILVFDSQMLLTGKKCRVVVNFQTGKGEISVT